MCLVLFYLLLTCAPSVCVSDPPQHLRHINLITAAPFSMFPHLHLISMLVKFVLLPVFIGLFLFPHISHTSPAFLTFLLVFPKLLACSLFWFCCSSLLFVLDLLVFVSSFLLAVFLLDWWTFFHDLGIYSSVH